MQKKISTIAEITPGYTFRKSINNDPVGDVFVLQAKNIIANKDLNNIDDLVKISSDMIRSPYYLEYNDILIISRSSSPGYFRSSVFTSSNKNVIASSSVYIIRIKDVTVIPKYLSLYLNSLDGQKILSAIASGGSYIKTMLIRNLSEIEIPIPPINTQKAIIALSENIKRQEEIFKRKQEIGQIIINQTFSKLK